MFAPMQKEISQETVFNRLVIISGLCAFTYLLILTQIFFKERTCFADMSFILFNIIKDQSLAIQVNRFGSAVTQVFPLAGVWLGCSLETIMRLYSASFILWYFVVFLICVFVFRKPKYGLLILFFATLMVSDTFYWTTNEQLQGIAFCILLFAFLDWGREKQISLLLFYPILFAGIFTAAFFHPLVLIGFVYFCIYKWITNKQLIWLYALFIFLGFYVIKLLFFTSNNYDQNAFSLLKMIPEKARYFLVLTPTKNFISYLFIHYYFWLIGFLFLLFNYFKKRNWNKLLLLGSFTVIYLFVVNTCFADGNLKFYMESHYLMLGFFISIPLSLEVFPSIKKNNLLLLILAPGLLIRCADLTLNHKKFSERISWMENFQAKTNHLKNKKLLIHDASVPMDTLLITWGSAYETWLLSSLKTPQNQRSILIDYELETLKSLTVENKSFFTRWGLFAYSDLPVKYFSYTDTSEYILFENK